MLKAVRDLGEFLVKKRGLDGIDILVESHKLKTVSDRPSPLHRKSENRVKRASLL